jgi:thioredoxin reductase (NADPH)
MFSAALAEACRMRNGGRGGVIRDEEAYLVTGPDLRRYGSLGELRKLPPPNPYYLEASVSACSRRATPQPIKRRTSAVGEGAMAIAFVHRYLASG